MGEMGKRPRKGGSRMERSHMMIRMVLMMALLSAPFPQPGLASDIPRAAERHRAELIRVSRAVWGLEAPVAVFAAQVHTESWWRNGTVSSAGAQGLAQFLPSTAEWLPRAVPELEREAGRPAPFNPGWALRALVSYDKALGEKVSKVGAKIDEEERTIETICMRLLLRQQPVARDLRAVSAALKMITDMERIGDQAEDIVEIIPCMIAHPHEEYPKIREMAKETIAMVTDSVDAYVKQDVYLAKAVQMHDDVVDNYFTRIKSGLIDMIAKNPAEGEYALDLLMIAKYFERIGDHATNIAEWVEFSVTGSHNAISS